VATASESTSFELDSSSAEAKERQSPSMNSEYGTPHNHPTPEAPGAERTAPDWLAPARAPRRALRHRGTIRPNAARTAGLVLLLGSLLTPHLAAAEGTNDGALYGKVTTKKGKVYQGALRWDDEEAFWDDHFNSGKNSLPYLERYSGEKKTRSFEIFGRKINVNWGDHQSGRQFVVRFGDIRSIEVTGDEEATLTMRDGSRHEVEGVGNDVEATIRILDATLGLLEVDWDAIDRIEFSAAPPDAATFGDRLWGKVQTTAGTFEGFVQWDKQECLSADKLDGEEDGVKMSLDFGQIASIAKHPERNASNVVLTDGRALVLDDSNDVDDDNRGILVEDVRFGRVEVPWKAFERIDLRTDRGSGSAYASYGQNGGGPLRGEVIDREGTRRSGQLVYDLDEAYTWELLDGLSAKVNYSIPFSKIKSISPRGADSATVTLRDGTVLELSDSHDVNEDNDGTLVLDSDGEGGVLVAWSDVGVVTFLE
jgi:hypothetical protein